MNRGRVGNLATLHGLLGPGCSRRRVVRQQAHVQARHPIEGGVTGQEPLTFNG